MNQRTLTQQLTRATARAIVGTVLLFGAVYLAGVASHAQQPGVTAQQAPGTPGAVLEAHGCWTGAAPVGATAHHAVLRVTLSGPVLYVGAATMAADPAHRSLFSQAIDQEVLGHPHRLTVYGFCR